VRVLGQQSPEGEDQAQRQKREREPTGRVVALAPPAADGNSSENPEEDAGDDAERSNELVQAGPPFGRRVQPKPLLRRNVDNTPMTTRVLVVDDDPGVRSAIARALRVDYDVDEAEDGADALAQHAAAPADAIVLDLLMPEVGGLEVCRSLRRRNDPVPVLVVTARDAVDDRIEGLDAGADDYLVKPFAIEELRARVRALLRRAGAGDDALRYGDVSLDPATREVYRGERRLQLTRTEFNLLELFMRNPKQVLTRSQIYERVWGYDFGATSNALWVYIGYLRRKLEENGEPRLLHTVRGVGYALREEP
jgi:two-component system response regulator MprA